MHYLTLLLLLFCASISANDKKQVFNDYSGNFKLSETNPEVFTTTFRGEVTILGELVIELIDNGEPNKVHPYKVSLIPDDKNILPYIQSGFYSMNLQKVDFLNAEYALNSTFSQEEIKIPEGSESIFLSKRGYFTLNEYATSVECDSRQYYANFVSYKPESGMVAYHVDRKELHGC